MDIQMFNYLGTQENTACWSSHEGLKKNLV